uniref:GNAT family N-acetyltransferase n=1 Tax=Klebsiella pneumoniae TaxID=573 RepID=UPI000B305D7E
MDSEEPPNVRVACSGDIDEVVRLMHDAAAWMSAKGTPAWDVARIDRTFAETFVLRSELLVASCSDGIVGCCTLSAEDPEFWPDALKGEAAYLHKLAVRRTHAGRGVSSALIELAAMPRERRGAPSCGSTATRTCVAYTSGSDSPTSTLSIPAGIQPSSQNA